jgi:hypothetical protein
MDNNLQYQKSARFISRHIIPRIVLIIMAVFYIMP